MRCRIFDALGNDITVTDEPGPAGVALVTVQGDVSVTPGTARTLANAILRAAERAHVRAHGYVVVEGDGVEVEQPPALSDPLMVDADGAPLRILPAGPLFPTHDGGDDAT